MKTIKNETLARWSCGESSSCPVEFLKGNQPPRLEGEESRYETRGGQRISHPSAYSRRGWSNMIYRSSTKRIIVGLKWIKKNSVILHKSNSGNCWIIPKKQAFKIRFIRGGLLVMPLRILG